MVHGDGVLKRPVSGRIAFCERGADDGNRRASALHGCEMGSRVDARCKAGDHGKPFPDDFPRQPLGPQEALPCRPSASHRQQAGHFAQPPRSLTVQKLNGVVGVAQAHRVVFYPVDPDIVVADSGIFSSSRRPSGHSVRPRRARQTPRGG